MKWTRTTKTWEEASVKRMFNELKYDQKNLDFGSVNDCK